MFRRNAMSQDVANVVLGVARSQRKLDVSAAKQIVTGWMRAKGFEQDRYGNWFPGPGRGTRFHFTKQNLQKQNKMYGRWHTLRSDPVIGAAENLVRRASETTGRSEEVAHLLRGAETRKRQRGRSAERRERQRVESEARSIAVKRVLHEHWDEAFRAVVLDEKGGPERFLRDVIMPQIESTKQKLTEQLVRGTSPRGPRYSLEQPPLVLFFNGADEHWTEVLGGVRYTIRVKNHSQDRAAVHIGRASQLGLQVDPVTIRMVADLRGVEAEGDAYVSGVIERSGPRKRLLGVGEMLLASLFFIQASEKRKRAGSRVLTLWCGLMAGYGIDKWVAQAVGPEGREFFEALERQGKLRIVKRAGADMLIEHAAMAPNVARALCS